MDNTQDNTEQTFAPTTEQTFGEYESTGEMTQMESTQEKPRGVDSSVDAGAKKSSNKMIYIGGGVAALLVVGFLMFGGNKGGQNTPPQTKPAPVAERVAPEPKAEPVVKEEPVAVAPTQEVVPPVEANVAMPTTPVVPVVKTAITPSSDLEEIKEMLIEQKSSIDDLIRRVEILEGKPASSIGGDVSGASLDAKPVVKKKKKIAKKTIEPAMAEIVSAGSNVNGEFLFNNPNKTVKTKNIEKTLTQYKVHSMYGSRFWMVKPDGTQGSYAVGDRLPFGEVVESIDLDAGRIKTSGGSIYTK